MRPLSLFFFISAPLGRPPSPKTTPSSLAPLMPILTFSLVPVVLTGTMVAEAEAATAARRAGRAGRAPDAGAAARTGAAATRVGRVGARARVRAVGHIEKGARWFGSWR